VLLVLLRVPLLLLLSVNVPGTYYTVVSTWNSTSIDQVLCPDNTYGAGFKKQRACVPCPTGFTTNGLVGATAPSACGEQCCCPGAIYVARLQLLPSRKCDAG
jgi:hypothetical protein